MAKSNYEAQQHRFLASSTSNANIQQQQKSSYSATGLFKKPRQPTKSYRPKENQLYRSKTHSQSYMSSTKKDFSKRIATQNSFSFESVCKETTIQNRDSQVGKTIDTSQQLGCLHRSKRCLSTHSDSSSIQEITLFHVRKSGLPIHGLNFRNVSVCGFSPN